MSLEASRSIQCHLFLLALSFHSYRATSSLEKDILFSAKIGFIEDQARGLPYLDSSLTCCWRFGPKKSLKSLKNGHSIFSEVCPWLFITHSNPSNLDVISIWIKKFLKIQKVHIFFHCYRWNPWMTHYQKRLVKQDFPFSHYLDTCFCYFVSQ